MKDRIFWKLIAVGVVLGLFAVAYGLCKNSQLPSPLFSTTAAYAAETAPEKAKLRPAEKPRLKFEDLLSDSRVGTFERAKVKGGWLVVMENLAGHESGMAITFYPDPNHEWDGGSLK